MASRENPCAIHGDCGEIAALQLAIITQRKGEANFDWSLDDFTNNLFVHDVTGNYLPNDCGAPIINLKLIEKEVLRLE